MVSELEKEGFNSIFGYTASGMSSALGRCYSFYVLLFDFRMEDLHLGLCYKVLTFTRKA